VPAHIPARNLPGDAHAAIAEELAQGYVVVAPDDSIEVEDHDVLGRWRIDPNTGDTLGMAWHDRRLGGQTMTQRQIMKLCLMQGSFFGVATFLGCAKLGKGGDAPGKKVVCLFCGIFAAIASPGVVSHRTRCFASSSGFTSPQATTSSGCSRGSRVSTGRGALGSRVGRSTARVIGSSDRNGFRCAVERSRASRRKRRKPRRVAWLF
jgi:hypothetical protein